MERLQVLGIMSGTSLDGLDMCWCEVSGDPLSGALEGAEIKAFDTVPLPAELRALILQQMQPEQSDVTQLCDLNFSWARYVAQAITEFLARHQHSLSDIDLLGSHGQTLFHLPPSHAAEGSQGLGSTLQLGDGGVLAALTGVTTVTQFRTADMALGGQGAPLVPYLDQLLFRSAQEPRILLNIGGMANLSYIPCQGDIVAFDTGPGNVLLDAAAELLTGEPHDWGGKLALQGQVHPALLQEVLAHPFFQQAPPRSTGREVFGAAYAQERVSAWLHQGLSTPDILATLTAVTTTSIVEACQRFLPVEAWQGVALYISGGGVHNQALHRGLQAGLPGVKIDSLAALDGHPDAKEAQAFAVLAVACLWGVPANVPTVTGAQGPVVLGQIAPGHNWRSLCQQTFKTFQEKTP